LIEADIGTPDAAFNKLVHDLAGHGVDAGQIRQKRDALFAIALSAPARCVNPAWKGRPSNVSDVMRRSFATIKPGASLPDANQRGLGLDCFRRSLRFNVQDGNSASMT
jgi:hypothetical protein